MIHHRKQFILVIGLLLCFGFFITSFASYYVSRNSLTLQIETSELPLTSDNIYSEIQKDLLQPIFISSLMASDTFLRDWIIEGEQDENQIRKYLLEIQTRYKTVTSFFVSDKTRLYYHYNAILKSIDPEENRDQWYFKAQAMESDYETNVDLDQANNDTITIFVNYKVFDYDGQFLGITGIGLTVNSVKKLIHTYQEKYQRNIYFTDMEGNIVLRGKNNTKLSGNIRQLAGLSTIAATILTEDRISTNFERGNKTIHLNSRFIPELDWYLLVEQEENITSSKIFRTLIINLFICVLVTILVLWLLNFTVNAYRSKLARQVSEDEKLRKINHNQERAISEQHKELLENNIQLEKALAEVKQLSGFLPICATCKKIRDDQGYWKQIETYIQDHSQAEFSHSICPTCAEKLYPGYFGSEDEKTPPSE